MTVANTSVRHFASTHAGAPSLNNVAGTLIALLDDCLINGYGAVTLTSLSVSSGIATATVSGGHGFAKLGNTGPVINISGATPTDLNGDWRIATIPNSTTFTFVSDTSDGSATGTISAKIAPLGWTKPYSGTNLAMYASAAGAAKILRVDDTGTTGAALAAYESATGINSGVNLWSPATLYAYKANSSTPAPWYLIGDNRGFFFHALAYQGTAYEHTILFGDYNSSLFDPTFPYNAIIWGDTTNSYNITSPVLNTASVAWARLMRLYTGVAGPVTPTIYGSYAIDSTNFGGKVPYPSTFGNKLIYEPIMIGATTATPMGIIRGIFYSLHNNLGSATYKNTVLVGDGLESDRDLLVLRMKNSDDQAILVDITGPW